MPQPFPAVVFKMILRAPVRVPVHFFHKIFTFRKKINFFYFFTSIVTVKPQRSTESYKLKITDAIIVQVSVALMVSASACTQVVQGSNPADSWQVIRNATAFSGCGI